MTFTKKQRRTVSLRNGQTFEYRLRRDWDRENRWLVVQETGLNGQYLLVDPYHLTHMPGQATMRNAIRAAFRLGWTPSRKKPPMFLKHDGAQYVLTDAALNGRSN